jgi:YD repeat-containing protein
MAPGPNSGYLVTGVQYNANDQMTQINYGSPDGGSGITESRGYNSIFQITSINASWFSSGAKSFAEIYVYSTTQNNGQITSVCANGTWNGTSCVNGELVSYQYDKLNRLISASSTLGWSQTYGYDGYGNLTSRSPGLNILADASTNRMVGFSYDGNGNLHSGNWGYDIENRLVSVDTGGGEPYIYDPSNKRIYNQNNSLQVNGGGETYYFYGLDGKVMGEYAVAWGNSGRTMQLNRVTESAYFAGRKCCQRWRAIGWDP